jgi:hypothetical protein
MNRKAAKIKAETAKEEKEAGDWEFYLFEEG